ncbi:PIG-L family deacetylase [Leucobacter sp. cx-328]|uniref:PIG-L family deacetylase n=1 Tax=unclassified Leucobacter TaxID=2621730 RepID=UPI00165E6E68|nr:MULTISPECIES: PIG-L family deacetylase [unclassified Leucobacter]MBC9943489.1 PIG-L family deacetylase [Leucobacter sp. cx-328]
MTETQAAQPAETADVTEWFGGRARVMFVHAHPDDETITTGGTLAALAAAGREPLLVTCTRGEQGEVVEGPLQALVQLHGLPIARQNELKTALGMLGIERHVFLGVEPARAEGLAPTIYEDSGMEWSEADPETGERRAIPSPATGPDAFTTVPAVEALNDLLTAAHAAGAQAIVSYDNGGGYGHPDHVLAHRLSRAVAAALGLPFWEIVGDDVVETAPAAETDDEGADPRPIESYDVSAWLDRKTAALRAHQTQLVVEGDEIVHVGGQREPIRATERFRRVVGM